MSLRQIVFPPRNRFFTGKRWTNICVRSLHLTGVAGVGGGFLYAAPLELWQPFLLLTLFSGMVLVGLEIYTNGIWLIQIRGVATLFKLGLLALVYVTGPQMYIIIPVILISGIISHAPANVRYYSLLHGRRQEFL